MIYVIDKLECRKQWGLFLVTKEDNGTRYTPLAYFKDEKLARDFARAKLIVMPERSTFQ